jgi:DNA-nicking Smr family endonuclease
MGRRLYNPVSGMAKKTRISAEDRALFRSALADVKPLSHGRALLPRQRRPARAEQRELDDRQVLQELLVDPPEDILLETGEELLYARPGLQAAVLRKLRRGKFAIEDELDLHRLTSAEAAESLSVFLAGCHLRGKRCVRVIHGKGNRSFNKQPVLKGKVDYWLRRRNDVLAFCSARPSDGGTGAVYILLRR